MIKLIVGTKGTGKTKTLIDMARKAAEESKGNVVCVEKGDKLAHELPNAVRLVNSEDITHLFVDGTFKIGKVGDVEKDYEGFAAMIQKLAKVQSDAQIIFTVSCDEADLPVTVKDYIVK